MTVAAVVVTAAVCVQGATADAPIDQVSASATAEAVAVRMNPPGPSVGGCQVFPGDNPWNTDISAAPLHPRSRQIVDKILSVGGDFLHPDFGSNPDYGIPYVVVPPDQPLVPIELTEYADESDPGPYPVPLDAPVEGGADSDGDRHVLVVQQGTCILYEMGVAYPNGAGWTAYVGAKWDLRTGALRPLTWTSADAAGLPILPGLVRYDEVAAGAVRHAIRVTFSQTQRAFILPATHFASSRTDPDLPPMGMRFRLSSSFDTSGFTGQSRVIVEAMKRYGFIVADNGSNWYFQGASDPRWDDDDLEQLKSIPGSAFEVVYSGDPQTG
ncbi:MAG: hypothetical protein AB7L17_05525 [Ilumatobacteraceae bacterium]